VEIRVADRLLSGFGELETLLSRFSQYATSRGVLIFIGKVSFTRSQCNFNEGKLWSFEEVVVSRLFRPWEFSTVAVKEAL